MHDLREFIENVKKIIEKHHIGNTGEYPAGLHRMRKTAVI